MILFLAGLPKDTHDVLLGVYTNFEKQNSKENLSKPDCRGPYFRDLRNIDLSTVHTPLVKVGMCVCMYACVCVCLSVVCLYVHVCMCECAIMHMWNCVVCNSKPGSQYDTRAMSILSIMEASIPESP